MEVDQISDNNSSSNRNDREGERKERSLTTTTTTFTTNAPRTWFRRNRVLRLENLDPSGTRQDIQASFEKRGFLSTWIDHTKDSTSGYARLNVPQAKEVEALIMAEGGLRVGTEIVRIRALEGEEEDSYWALAVDRDYSNASKRLLRQHKSLKPKVRIPANLLRKRFVLSSSSSGGAASSLEEDNGTQQKKKNKASKGLRYVPYKALDDDEIMPPQDAIHRERINHLMTQIGGSDLNSKNAMSFDGVDCTVQSSSSNNRHDITNTSLETESAEEIVAKFEKLYLDV
ncbi:1364_t:CDS:2 [Ambispora leptoticha]|uniref:1364_t:CDS:1 n=1 Tax=Ambispora leptoticha TaxID=144679 RepID=A0A9N8ZGW1_9GLOM|nr:1364_t:CDS:2 [Ambispora leptoticha]